MYVDAPAYIDDHRVEAKLLIMQAHDLLKRNGWVQGMYDSKDGEHCLVGALRAVALQTADQNDAGFLAVLMLGRAIGLPKWMTDRYQIVNRIEAWNDDLSRTKRQVLAAMKRAAT